MTAYTSVRGTPPASVPFVTVSYVPVVVANLPAHLELWFHPQPQGVADNLNIAVKSPSVTVLREPDGLQLFPHTNQPPTNQAPTQFEENVWFITLKDLELEGFPTYLRLVFSTERHAAGTCHYATAWLVRGDAADTADPGRVD